MLKAGGRITEVFGWTAVICAMGIVGTACSHGSTESAAVSRANALAGPITITLQVPHALSVLAPAVVGAQAVSMSASASVAGTIVAMSNAGFSSEPDSTLNDIWSRGPAILKDRDKVTGTVHASSVQKGSSVVISGGIDSSSTFDPVSSLSWTVTYPAGTATDVIVNAGQTRTLAPGLYGNLALNSQATLDLSTGTYFLSSLDMEAASKIHLDQTNGPVIIYETTGLTLRGAFDTTDGSDPDLLLGYLGTNSVFVESQFTGTLIAPFAGLSLRRVTGAHRGYFYGQSVADLEGANIEYRAPSVLAQASGVDVEACSNLLVPPQCVLGTACDQAYQKAIARYCTMPGASSCEVDLTSRVNVDYTMAAAALVGQTQTPAQYLSLVRDRTRKKRAAENNPTVLNALCTGHDADGDLVPDNVDACPGTAALTATDDTGCTLTTLPDAPTPQDVSRVFANSGMLANLACAGAAPIPRVPAGAFYYPSERALGTFVLSGRVTGQPAGCPVWYFFDIQVLSGGQASQSFWVAFKDSEASNALVGTPNPVPAGYIQFNALPGDASTRGTLGSIGGTSVRFRVQAMNGAGTRSGWSDWKVTTNADCDALGFHCG